MRNRILRFLCALSALLVSTWASAGEVVSVYRRVAVIGSMPLQRSGLIDVVSVQLQGAGIDLVEREQLSALIHEQTLDATLGAEGLSNRIKIGRLVKADVLALLSEEGGDKDRRVRLIVAECAEGARLSSTSYSSAMPGADMAQAIAAHIATTLKRFSGGMKALIGVPPFIAKNFTYEYHAFQTGYAVLLQDSLSKLPGVAVVEVEEAQAIRKELETSGGQANAVVPVFVEGEFEVTTPTGKPPDVRFHMVLQTPEKSRSIERTALTFDQASQFVSRDLPHEILPDRATELGRSFSADEEFTNLTARADAFDSLGEWALAADLRQAALVMQPDNEAQRTKLFNDCSSVVRSVRTLPDLKDRGEEGERLLSAAALRYVTELECVEWRIRQSQSDPRNHWGSAAAAMDIVWLRPCHAAELAQAAKRDFVLNVYLMTWNPAWNTRKPGRRHDPRDSWMDTLLTIVLSTTGRPLIRQDYDLLLHILNDVAPERTPPSLWVTCLLWGHNHFQMRSGSDSAFLDFLSELQKSKRPLNRVLAREAMLSWTVSHTHRLDPRLKPIAEKIRHDFLALNLPPSKYRSPGVLEELDYISEAVSRSQQSNGSRVPATRPEDTVGHTLESSRVRSYHPVAFAATPPQIYRTGALEFNRIAFAHHNADGQIQAADAIAPGNFPGANHLLQCTSTMDVAWDEYCVNFMHEPGQMQFVWGVSLFDKEVTDVQWDGAHVWVATRRHFLLALDTTGAAVAKIGASEGLPPCDQGAQILTLGPDRLVVCGSFGPSNRAFLAMVEKAGERWQVKVFHTATRVTPHSANEFDPDLVFIPASIARCRSRDGGDFLVIRRSFCAWGAYLHPLLVDLRTLHVSASGTEISQYPSLAVAGGIMQMIAPAQYTVWRPSDGGTDLMRDPCTLTLPDVRGDSDIRGMHHVWTVGADGLVYLPGNTWFRIDPKSMTICPLTNEGLPGGTGQCIAPSHAGLLYWGVIGASTNTMYSVHVDEEAAKKLPHILPGKPVPAASQSSP